MKTRVVLCVFVAFLLLAFPVWAFGETSINISISHVGNTNSVPPEERITEQIFRGGDPIALGTGSVNLSLTHQSHIPLEDNSGSGNVPGLYVVRGVDSGGRFVEFLVYGFHDVSTIKEDIQFSVRFTNGRVASVDHVQTGNQRWLEQAQNGVCGINMVNPYLSNSSEDEYTLSADSRSIDVCASVSVATDKLRVYYESVETSEPPTGCTVPGEIMCPDGQCRVSCDAVVEQCPSGEQRCVGGTWDGQCRASCTETAQCTATSGCTPPQRCDVAAGSCYDPTPPCATGKTQCTIGVEQICVDENECPISGQTCIANGICDTDEGCLCADCFNDHDSCAVPTDVCLESTKECGAPSASGCASGQTKCTINGIERCYPSAECAAQLDPRLLNAHWTNYIGERVSTSSVNSTVFLVVDASDIAVGSEVRFLVNESDSLLTGDDDVITALNGTVGSDGRVRVSWFIRDAEFNKGVEVGDGDNLEFYFVAISGVLWNKSDELVVNKHQGADQYVPTSIISKPIHRQIYFTGVPLEFNESSVSAHGPIKSFEWKIEEEAFGSAERSFMRQFSSGGLKTISLKVTDPFGLSAESQIAVLVLDGNGLFGFINKPFHRQIVNEEGSVSYAANESYVVNVSGIDCAGSISCLAGLCPSETDGIPAGCSAMLPVVNVSSGFELVRFDWDFGDGTYRSGMGEGFVGGRKLYSQLSSVLNDKLIRLQLNYTNESVLYSVNVSVSRQFSVVGISQCVDDGRTFVQIDRQGLIQQSFSTLNSEACRLPGTGLIGGGDDCCPAGFECTTNGCVQQTVTRSCSDYTARTSCTEDNLHIGDMVGGSSNKDPLWNTIQCGQTVNGVIIRCECSWNVTSSGCGLTKVVSTASSSTGEIAPGANDYYCEKYRCTYSTTSEGACESGSRRIVTDASFSAGNCRISGNDLVQLRNECSDIGQDVPCGSALAVDLPVFGMWQGLLGVLGISFMYFFFVGRGRKR